MFGACWLSLEVVGRSGKEMYFIFYFPYSGEVIVS